MAFVDKNSIPSGIITKPDEIVRSPIQLRNYMDECVVFAASYCHRHGELDILGTRGRLQDLMFYMGSLNLSDKFKPEEDLLMQGIVTAADDLPFEISHGQAACLFYDTWYCETFSTMKELIYNVEIMFQADSVSANLSIDDFTVVIGRVYSRRVFLNAIRMSRRYNRKYTEFGAKNG